jgi:predicted nucleic acid-binding protein
VNERLLAFLDRHRRIGIDTSPFVYQVEDHPAYAPIADALFRWVAAGHSVAVTSTLTITEVLTLPYRQARPGVADGIFSVLLQMENIEWLSPSIGVADRAARARAAYQLRTVDAIQVATAITGGATGLVTNDQDFRRVTDLEVLMLDDLLA